MKRCILYLAVLVVIVAGCQKDVLEITPEEPAQGERADGLPKGAFLLTTEDDEGATKTVADGKKVYWKVGDEVLVNGNYYAIKSANNQFYIEPGADGTPLITDDYIYGYYNCGDVGIWNSFYPRVTIPSEYESMITDTKQEIALPMAAYGDKSAGTIQFKQLTAALSLTINNSTGFILRLDEVTLSCSDRKFSGSTNLSFKNANYSQPSENGNGSVTLHIKGIGANNGCYIAKDGSVTVQVPFLPVNNATVNILVRANSNLMAVTTNQDIDGDSFNGVLNTDYEFRYSYTPEAKLTLARNQMMTASVTLKRAAESNGRVTEVDHGLFSAAANNYRIVRFSMGNLRYKATASSNTKWSFHDHQYDIVGSRNWLIGETFDDYIDLFGWATSGYNNGQECYQPWSSSTSEEKYYYDDGAWSVQQDNIWVPTTLDWAFNLMTENLYNYFNWHTMSKSMWEYIFDRDNGNKWGGGTVADMRGCILLPDDWVQPYGVPDFHSGKQVDNHNIYTADEWVKMEKAGAVFLPHTGRRAGNTVNYTEQGSYWTTSYYNDGNPQSIQAANSIIIRSNGEPTYSHYLVYYGFAVRLVAYVN